MLGKYGRYDEKLSLFVYGVQKSFNGKKELPALLMTLGALFIAHFHVLCDRPLLNGKTTATS